MKADAAEEPTTSGGMPSTPLNVLLLVIDDLRPELAAYGFPTVTPHLDAFASSALTFGRAYVQYSHCSPSRDDEKWNVGSVDRRGTRSFSRSCSHGVASC